MEQSDDYFELKSDNSYMPSNHSLTNLNDTEEIYQNSSYIYNFSKNYEQPWDLSHVRQNLEDKLQNLMSSKKSENIQTNSISLSPVELNDLRSQEGYDKPWDLRPHKKDERGQEGYDRPWDLKPHNMDERPTEEYDVPWDKNARRIEKELRAAHKESIKRKDGNKASMALNSSSKLADNASVTVDSPRTSWISRSLKVEDTRCNEEYDEPWDQKMKNIITQAVQLRSQNNIMVVAQPRKSLQTKRSKVSLIDLKAPLEKQSWYHGIVSRTQAESILRAFEEGGYLVRISESNHRDYSLSVKSTKGFMHMRITKQESGFVLGQFSQPFQSIPQMIHHYTINKLPIKGAEHISLVHPIPHECL